MTTMFLIGLGIFLVIVAIAVWANDIPNDAIEIDNEEAAEVAAEDHAIPPPPKPPEEFMGGAGDNA
jgi:hypothetical protein